MTLTKLTFKVFMIFTCAELVSKIFFIDLNLRVKSPPVLKCCVIQGKVKSVNVNVVILRYKIKCDLTQVLTHLRSSYCWLLTK